MSSRQKNDLFTLFRSMLNERQIPEEKWNTPPDDLFDNAMSFIDHNKRRKKRGFFLPLLLFFGFLLSGYLILDFITTKSKSQLSENSSFTHNFKSLNQEAESVSQISLNKNTNYETELYQPNGVTDEIKIFSTNTIDQSYLEQGNINKNEPESAEEEIKPLSSSLAPNDPNQNRIYQKLDENTLNDFTTVLNNQNLNNDKFDLKYPTQVLTKVVLRNNDNSINKGQISIPRGLIKFTVLPSLKSRVKFQRTLENVNPELVVDKVDFRKFSLNIYYRQLYSTISMNNIPDPMSSNLTEYDKFYGGYLSGIATEYFLHPNLSTEFGFSFGRYRNESKFINEMAYDKENEVILDNEQISYPLSVDVMTPFGSYETNISFNAKTNSINDDAPMLNKWNIKQLISMFNIGIGMNYSLPVYSKIRINSGIGLNSHFLRTVDHQLSGSLVIQNKNMIDIEKNPDMMTGTKNQFFSLYLKSGIEYELKKNISLDFGLSYYHSLTSMLKQDISSDPSTFMNIIGSQLGIKYKF